MIDQEDFAERYAREWKNSKRLKLSFVDEMVPFIRIMRIAAQLEKSLKIICDEAGVTTAQFQAMAALRRMDPVPLTAKDIILATVLTSGSVTSMLDSLIKKKLVVREVSEEDARHIQIRLTSSGKKLIEKLLKIRTDELKGYADYFSEAELKDLSGLLKNLAIKIDQ